MFGIGTGEVVGLGVVALVVVGPERLPRLAAEAGQMLRKVRRMAADARAEVADQLGPEFQDISLNDLNPRTFVRRHLLEDDDIDALRFDDDDGPGRVAREQRPLQPDEPAPYDPDAT
jgi:sec-independent protein translocase protein TatB